jgi:hypothetical protein
MGRIEFRDVGMTLQGKLCETFDFRLLRVADDP